MFSDYGITLVLGRLECLFLSKQGFLALGEDYLDLLGRQSSGRFHRCRMQSAAAPFLSPRTGLLVFPLGTLTSQAFACASER